MQRVRLVGRTIAAQRVDRAEHEARGRSDGRNPERDRERSAGNARLGPMEPPWRRKWLVTRRAAEVRAHSSIRAIADRDDRRRGTVQFREISSPPGGAR